MGVFKANPSEGQAYRRQVATGPRRRLRPSDLRREARLWRLGALGLFAVCGVVLVLNLVLAELHPGNTWGLAYGIAAAVLLVTTALYAVRRRTMRWATRFAGRGRAWLWLHVWGGALFLLLASMHSGFAWPTGALTWWLFLLSWWTVLSGLAGLFLQRWIPRVLSSGLSVEVNYERIPELIDEVRSKAEALVAGADETISELYERSMASELAAPNPRFVYFTDVTGGIRSRLTDLEYLRRFLPAEEKEKLDKLEELFRVKLEIDAHYTLQRVLRNWLYFHVPPSVVLLGLVVLHVLTVLYY
jgi:hypothetical protein